MSSELEKACNQHRFWRIGGGQQETHDVFPQSLAVELLSFHVVTRESVLRVGNEDTTVRSALEDTKDTGSGRSALKTSVEEALERSWSIFSLSLGQFELSLNLGNTLVLVGEAELGQRSSCDKETDGVGCKLGQHDQSASRVKALGVRLTGSPVGETVLDAVSGELMRISRGKDDVSLNLGVDDLGDDVPVCETDDQTVLWRVVLVLGLGH